MTTSTSAWEYICIEYFNQTTDQSVMMGLLFEPNATKKRVNRVKITSHGSDLPVAFNRKNRVNQKKTLGIEDYTPACTRFRPILSNVGL